MEITWVDDPANIDFRKVTALLSETYWCKGITYNEVVLSAMNSALVIAAYCDGGLVGYLRVISDKVRFAYVLDVVVDERYQRQGIGQGMVNAALAHDRLKHVYQWLLRTSTAHGVYAKSGFTPVEQPENWMIYLKPRPDLGKRQF